MPIYYLSLLKHYTPFNIPTTPEIILTLTSTYPKDDDLTVRALRGAQSGIFEITLKAESDAIMTIPLKVEGKNVNLNLVPADQFISPTQQANTVLLTLYNSTGGPLKAVENEMFDQVLKEHGTISRPTAYQRHKGTTAFNGNRFCVIIPRGTIPDQVQIANPATPGKLLSVTIGYKGKKKYCARCLTHHLGQCEYLKKFYEAKDLKKSMEVKTQIISDSTLRQADDTGLSADITCMSGGRIGNISHTIIDDPKMSKATEVIVVAGVNDISCDSETSEQFIAQVGKGIDKLQHNVFGKNKKLTIVAPLLPAKCSELQQHKLLQYNKLIEIFLENKDHPFTYIVPPVLEMTGMHPTKSGTDTLLKFIDSKKKIITNESFISDTTLYRGVTSIFKYGCLHCQKYLEVNEEYLCPKCITPPPSTPEEGESTDGEVVETEPEDTPDIPTSTPKSSTKQSNITETTKKKTEISKDVKMRNASEDRKRSLTHTPPKNKEDKSKKSKTGKK